jgi:major membrane immunogen (membrane-anchored lipoprotein)
MDESAGTGNSKKIIAALAVLVLIAIMVFGAKALTGGNENTAANNGASSGSSSANVESATSSGTSQAAGEQADSSGTYKDGEHSATGSYRSPGGQQAITIKVTVQDGKITDTSAESGATDGTSRDFQSKFISGYKAQIVGKSLDEVRLDKVSGSSLTPQGFNDAIDQIKESAKA